MIDDDGIHFFYPKFSFISIDGGHDYKEPYGSAVKSSK